MRKKSQPILFYQTGLGRREMVLFFWFCFFFSSTLPAQTLALLARVIVKNVFNMSGHIFLGVHIPHTLRKAQELFIYNIIDTPCPPTGVTHFSPIETLPAKHSARPLWRRRKFVQNCGKKRRRRTCRHFQIKSLQPCPELETVLMFAARFCVLRTR